MPPPQPRLARRAADRPNLLEELRKELISFLHTGHIKPGDRLPSIRALARQKKLDHRIVANAYRQLQEDGLVEIRGRSGVVAAEIPRAEAQRDNGVGGSRSRHGDDAAPAGAERPPRAAEATISPIAEPLLRRRPMDPRPEVSVYSGGPPARGYRHALSTAPGG